MPINTGKRIVVQPGKNNGIFDHTFSGMRPVTPFIRPPRIPVPNPSPILVHVK